jgi:hypothetical protein
LWLRTNEEGVCRIVFREMWCGWGGEKPQLGDELRSGCWNPAPNNSQTGKIAYGFVDADDSFLLDPRPVQRGRFGYFSVATACFAEQGESICYLYFDAGLGATERKYSITLHLAPPEPATEPSGRR